MSLRRVIIGFFVVGFQALTNCGVFDVADGVTPTAADCRAQGQVLQQGQCTTCDNGEVPNDAGTQCIEQQGPTDPDPPVNDITEYPQDLPAVNGPCPSFVSGTVTFHPKNSASNNTRLWVGDNPGNGPLVFYFHGTGMSPDDATWSLGEDTIDAILEQGGVVLSPKGHGEYAWWIAHGTTREDDLWLIDEMVACAIEEVNIDIRRIHATGLSSGATLTSDMIHRRSNYLASGSPKSGGFDPYNQVPANVEPDNKISVMIFHGGESDTWGDPPYEFYQPQSEKLVGIIKEEGGFAVICNHGQGHKEPTWDSDVVWQFFQDHPWNTSPSPYEGGLPDNFPSYCSIW